MKKILLACAALCLLAGAAMVLPWFLAPASMMEIVQVQGIKAALGDPDIQSGPRGDLAVYSGGEGPTVVLVHGFGDSASGWGQVAGQLTEDHRVVVPDMPGSGLSAPGPDGDLAFEDLRLGLERVLEAEADPLVLVGNSLGGMLVTRYALDHPERDLHVVLVNAAVVKTEIPAHELIPSTREELAIKNAKLFGPDAIPSMPGFIQDGLIELIDQHRYHALHADLSARERWLDDEIGSLTHPLTVIWGTPDGYFPLTYAQGFADDIHVLDGCGHGPQYTCAQSLSDAIRDR